MPRPKKPPRLWLRRDGDGKRRWVILDGHRYKRTGCLEAQTAEAEAALSRYLAEKRKPNTSIRRASKANLGDILTLYLDLKETTIARPRDLRAQIARLNEFWGGMTADAIKGEMCRRYVAERGAKIGARRELEIMRAAVHHYAKEYGLDVTPRFTLGENHKSRDRWITRSEAARLLWAAYRSPYHQHIARFILIGLYTGTRHSAILGLQWMPNTTGGWVDLERGILHRRGSGQRETNKRQPPTRIPPRLLTHLRRWKHLDMGVRAIIRYEGLPITRIEKAFRSCRERAGLGYDITPHTLRHTRATWLAQAGVPIWEAAGSLGMTAKQFEDTYGHHHADFQKRAAEAY
jgi:integrase